MNQKTDVIEIINGGGRVVFHKTNGGWTPDWFYQDERRMLRFKDHEWLSLGHVRPTAAETAEPLANGGYLFSGRTDYGSTPVDWRIRIEPDNKTDGFLFECSFTPTASIELLEAFTAFETPYEYDGSETVTTVVGMNPVSKWRGAERLTPPIWENPAWVYSRPQSVRMTAPCHAPYLCQWLESEDDQPARCITLAADWNACCIHDVHAAPTRDTPNDPPSVLFNSADTKGYKYLVGALNWSSAYAKDPNVLFEGERSYRQRLAVTLAEDPPSGRFDRACLDAWQRAAHFSLPSDGRIDADRRVSEHGVTWQSATAWLRDVYVSTTPTEDLYDPDRGICTYATGSRPKAGGHYTWHWWPQWAGLLHYRAFLTGDDELKSVCARNDQKFAKWSADQKEFTHGGIAGRVTNLPALWWAFREGSDSVLGQAFKAPLEASCEMSAGENAGQRAWDYGAQATFAEALLLGAEIYGSDSMRRQAHVLLDEMDRQLDEAFWAFNVGRSDSLLHGGQIRSLGHGHAIMANLIAYRQENDRQYLDQAHRFARYLLAVSYACHNASSDPDFDFRGWCNGSNAGRDQIAEFPPWETQNGLLCQAALLSETETELEEGFYDALWYIARTGLAQFPAARSLKRLMRPDMTPVYVPRDTVASEADFYDRWPYLAYENPHDQTLLASYQGTDCLLGELVWGGGLARARDARVSAIVAAASLLDLTLTNKREIVLWNPTDAVIETVVDVTWPHGTVHEQNVTVRPRVATRMSATRP